MSNVFTLQQRIVIVVKVIDANDTIAPIEQGIDQMRPYKARCTRNHINSHAVSINFTQSTFAKATP
jgi:hypothetical protein